MASSIGKPSAAASIMRYDVPLQSCRASESLQVGSDRIDAVVLMSMPAEKTLCAHLSGTATTTDPGPVNWPGTHCSHCSFHLDTQTNDSVVLLNSATTVLCPVLCVAHLHTAVLIIYDLSPRWLYWTLLLLQKGKKSDFH